MDTTKLRRLLLTAALPAAGLVAAIGVAAAVDGPRPTPAGSVQTSPVSGTATSTTGVTTVTSAPGDISGPCDEAEHAEDPRCTGADATTGTTGTPAVTSPSSTSTSTPSTSTPSTTPSSTPSTTVTSTPGDISGPCDEAEHADDPRCTGAGGDDNNSGPGSGGDDDDDNSGPGSRNSGPGGGGDDDDNSGSGGGDDDD